MKRTEQTGLVGSNQDPIAVTVNLASFTNVQTIGLFKPFIRHHPDRRV